MNMFIMALVRNSITPEFSSADCLIRVCLQKCGQAKGTNETLRHPETNKSGKLLTLLDLKGKGRNSAT